MDTARADAAAWFPEWAAEHLGLTCQVCVKWGGPALCAAIEAERRGVATRMARADAAAKGASAGLEALYERWLREYGLALRHNAPDFGTWREIYEMGLATRAAAPAPPAADGDGEMVAAYLAMSDHWNECRTCGFGTAERPDVAVQCGEYERLFGVFDHLAARRWIARRATDAGGG